MPVPSLESGMQTSFMYCGMHTIARDCERTSDPAACQSYKRRVENNPENSSLPFSSSFQFHLGPVRSSAQFSSHRRPPHKLPSCCSLSWLSIVSDWYTKSMSCSNSYKWSQSCWRTHRVWFSGKRNIKPKSSRELPGEIRENSSLPFIPLRIDAAHYVKALRQTFYWELRRLNTRSTDSITIYIFILFILYNVWLTKL